MIFIDSDVFVIDMRYRRDRRFRKNSRFLERVREGGDGATMLVNLLEVAGILSHNLGRGQLRSLLVHFPTHYRVKVLPPPVLEATVPPVPVSRLMAIIEEGCSFGDALVLDQVEQHATAGSILVSWNAAHFEGKSRLRVCTPATYDG